MRTKIILPNLIVILAVGIAGYLYIGTNLRAESEDNLRADTEILADLFVRSEALRGYELLFDVRQQTMTKDVTQAFTLELAQQEGESAEDFEKRARQAWFRAGVQAVEMYSELWKQKGKKPELVLLTDRNGVVLARNTTPNACPAGRNVTEGMSVVKRALDGEVSYSIWSASDVTLGTGANVCKLINTKLLELAAAPVWVGDNIAGVLVLGFEISNGVAKEKKKAIGEDVAVLIGGKIYSSSFTNDSARESLEEQLTNAAREYVDGALDKGARSGLFTLDIEGERYIATVVPARNAEQKDRIAYVVMASVGKAAYFQDDLTMLLVFMAAAALLVIVLGVILGGHFLRPIVEIEDGLLKVINGEYEYRFDVKSREVGGLSYRINQLIGVLVGEDEEEDEEE